MNIEKLYHQIPNTAKIQSDTRKLKKGDIFWALKGENFDGNTFIPRALELGASLAVSDDISFKNHKNVIITEDNLKSLQKLATYHRRKLNIPILAVTGSNGKTTTKELLYHTMSTKFITQATEGNLNNHIGVPLTLLSFDYNTEFGIVEMGANHIGEIAALCLIAQPDFGLITNIGKAHLEGFGSYEGVIKAKTELYEYLKHKLVFVNADNPLLKEKSTHIKQFTYGKSPNADVLLHLENTKPFLKLMVEKPEVYPIQSQLTGSYNFENIAAAVAVSTYFNISLEQIAKAVKNYQAKNNRSQIISHGSSRIILDAYNANPSSMAAAVTNLYSADKQRIIIILGDMFELGDYAPKEHQAILQLIVKINSEHPDKYTEVYTAGPHFLHAAKSGNFTNYFKLHSEESLKDLEIKLSKQKASSNTLVLIKGSRGMKMENILPTVKKITE